MRKCKILFNDQALSDLRKHSGLNVIAFVMIFLWVPETKQRTLEELDYICKSSKWIFARRYRLIHGLVAVPTRRHMQYQVYEVIPWAFNRYILRRPAELHPLYKFQRTY